MATGLTSTNPVQSPINSASSVGALPLNPEGKKIVVIGGGRRVGKSLARLAARADGPVMPGCAWVSPRGHVHLAMADLAWAKLGDFVTVAIDAKHHRLGLSAFNEPVSMGRPMLRRDRFNGELRLHPHLNDIGVDPARAALCNVTVTRERRGEHGTRQLVLAFPADAVKTRARKHKHGGTR